MQLLDRHGVVTREAALAEGIPGGFAGVYPVLRAMEEAGQVRRGYFVAGLGAAQFAMPGAVDRLRAVREAAGRAGGASRSRRPTPRSPTAPRSPGPTAEGRPARAAGAYVVLGGRTARRVPRAGRTTVVTFADADATAVADALAGLVKDGRLRRIELRRIDGEEPDRQPLAEALRAIGAVDGLPRAHAARLSRARGRHDPRARAAPAGRARAGHGRRTSRRGRPDPARLSEPRSRTSRRAANICSSRSATT